MARVEREWVLEIESRQGSRSTHRGDEQQIRGIAGRVERCGLGRITDGPRPVEPATDGTRAASGRVTIAELVVAKPKSAE
jgi:hypothetical protein